eukprot:6676965-Pyramimonas_sp.AAC.1
MSRGHPWSLARSVSVSGVGATPRGSVAGCRCLAASMSQRARRRSPSCVASSWGGTPTIGALRRPSRSANLSRC